MGEYTLSGLPVIGVRIFDRRRSTIFSPVPTPISLTSSMRVWATILVRVVDITGRVRVACSSRGGTVSLASLFLVGWVVIVIIIGSIRIVVIFDYANRRIVVLFLLSKVFFIE